MTELIGVIAGLIITSSYIPQIIKIYKTKQVRDISLVMYLMLTLSLTLWIIYSFRVDLFALKFTNITGLTLVTIVLLNKIFRSTKSYESKRKKEDCEDVGCVWMIGGSCICTNPKGLCPLAHIRELGTKKYQDKWEAEEKRCSKN
jgi:MtN3 and saliva related transmembrane protein